MKRSKILLGLISCMLICSICLTLMACGKTNNQGDDIVKEEEKVFDIIKDGTNLYTIVRPENASTLLARTAVSLNQYVLDQGITSKLTNWDSDDANVKEILFGKSKFFPEKAISGIDLNKIGSDGFVIKAFGNKIIIIANNDHALIGAAEYFKTNFLNVKEGKTTMPENYCYVSTNGLFLSELLLAGKSISEYALSADEGLETPLSYLAELIKGKCGAELNENGKNKIRLTTKGAQGSKISAKFENGDLVICAKDADAMKKAIVCFWYENVDHATSKLSLDKDLSYTRDLSETVFYSDFNVKQSKNECCMDALISAHNYANEKGFKVFADFGANYYLSSTGKTINIKTDVEWGNAKFIIDDSKVTPQDRGNWIFSIPGSYSSYSINTIKTVSRDMTNLGITLPQKSIVTLNDANTTHYIRYGGNADAGQAKRDSIVVSADGSIDTSAPIMWDFDNITSINVLPIDEKTLTVSGGVFTTVANQAPSEYTYYARGIRVTRSNTNILNVTHYITGEGATGAPYSGFLSINNCAYINVENCVFTGHKTYQSPTTAMGSYDIGMGGAICATFKNCTQANDINDKKYWGVSGTNYCKNFVYDGCVLSRFDAHKGVANAAIKNSVIGHAGASIIGYGTLLIENSTFFSSYIVILREDYGSSWEGDLIIRDCKVCPLSSVDIHIIKGSNTCTHDFGYDSYMPINVEIDGLYAYTSKSVYVFSNLNSECKSESYSPKYNYFTTQKVRVANFETNSKEALEISPNKILFKNTEFTVE